MEEDYYDSFNFEQFTSDNPPTGGYDPFPDTSLGAEFYGPAAPTQEQLGAQIIQDTQRGLDQERLGREIVEGSFIDQFLASPDNTAPWFKGIDGSLAATGAILKSVGLLGRRDPTPTQGGIPIQLGGQPSFGAPDGRGVMVVSPSNTTRDGRSGSLRGPMVNGFAGPLRTATGTIQVGGLDFLYIALGLVGAFVAYKAVKAIT